MHRFIDGEDRMQQALLPHCLEDYVSEENPVRVIEVFIGITFRSGIEAQSIRRAAIARSAAMPGGWKPSIPPS
jgi:hypothetical protein